MADTELYTRMIIDTVVNKDRRNRLKTLAGNTKRRSDFVDNLCHDRRYLDYRTLCAIGKSMPVKDIVSHLVKVAGNKKFMCIGNCELDNTVIELSGTHEVLFDSGLDLILFSVLGCCGFYSNHEGERFFIVQVVA